MNEVVKKKPSIFKRWRRVVVDSINGFIEDDCYSKASALTFYSLMSIVPVLAVLFGIAKGFGFEKALESEILEKFSEQPEIANKVIEFAYSWLKTVQGGIIAGIGTILLLWSVIGMLNNIEGALNAIWKTRVARSYTRKISDYLAVIIIAPLVLITTSSINVYLTTHLAETAHYNAVVSAIGQVLLFILKFFPYFLSWVLFTFIYMFMPNTKVYFRSAVIAGIIAGTAFQLWQWIYIKFQIGAASYGAIYGSFAALPLFLIWLQVSWMILLAGAEIAVQLENDLFLPERPNKPISRKVAAMLITYQCIAAFFKGEKPLTDVRLAKETGITLNQIHELVETLRKADILSIVLFPDKTHGYQPARNIQSITMKDVYDAEEKGHEIMASITNAEELAHIEQYFTQVDEALSKPEFNRPVFGVTHR